MTVLPNEPSHHGIIDHGQSQHPLTSTTTGVNGSTTAAAAADVYIIPDYSISRTHPQHLLVLPFVPHPSTASMASTTLTPASMSNAAFQAPPPPPHYFCTASRYVTSDTSVIEVLDSTHDFSHGHARTSTPFNDPPPEYDAIASGHHSYTNHGASIDAVVSSTSAYGVTPSCSCMTQLTSVADDYGEKCPKYFGACLLCCCCTKQ